MSGKQPNIFLPPNQCHCLAHVCTEQCLQWSPVVSSSCLKCNIMDKFEIYIFYCRIKVSFYWRAKTTSGFFNVKVKQITYMDLAQRISPAVMWQKQVYGVKSWAATDNMLTEQHHHCIPLDPIRVEKEVGSAINRVPPYSPYLTVITCDPQWWVWGRVARWMSAGVLPYQGPGKTGA